MAQCAFRECDRPMKVFQGVMLPYHGIDGHRFVLRTCGEHTEQDVITAVQLSNIVMWQDDAPID